MNTKLTETIINMFTQFGVAYQLPAPDPEYVIAIQGYLSTQKWRLSELSSILNILLKDKQYAETAKFGKYPTVYDFFRIRNQAKSKPFYDALSVYLSGNWWAKDEVLALATPEQMNAIITAGGLSRLYERANCEIATPVYKLLDIVAQNESETSSEPIDTEHRIGAPQTLKQITNLTKKNLNVNS